MAGELARMFASLGFKVDPSGAELFESQLRSLRASSANLARNLKVVGDQLDNVKKKVLSLNSAMNKDSKVGAKQGVTNSYSKMATYVDRVTTAQEKLNLQAPSLIDKLDKIRATVWKGSNAWEAYSKNIAQAKREMDGFHQLAGLAKTGRVTVNNRVYGQQSSSIPRPHVPSEPQQGSLGATALIAGGFRDFFRSMTPATAIAGGLVSTGYAVKETVQTGREMTKMNNVLLMAAKNTDQYREALEFVNKESNRLGQDVQELGMAFGKVLQSGRDKMKFTDIQKVFTGFGELMTAMGANVDDQKGIYRAFGQMLTKGKVEAEEEGQMAERGLPAKDLIKKASMKVYGVDTAGYEAMRKSGSVKIEDIAVELASMMSAMARNNEALDKMLQTSAVQQQRFVNEWKKFAQFVMDSGLDAALAGLFRGMTKVLELVVPFLRGLGIAVKAIYDLISGIVKWYTENAVLAGTLTSLVALLVIFSKSLFSVTAATTALGAGVVALWSRYGMLLIRLGLVTAAVWALYEAFTAIARSNQGELNWVTRMGAEFQVLYSEIDVAIAKVEEFFAVMGYYRNNPLELVSTGTARRVQNATNPLSFIIDQAKKLSGLDKKMKAPDSPNLPSNAIPDFGSSNIRRTVGRIDIYNNERLVGTLDPDLGDMGNAVKIDMV